MKYTKKMIMVPEAEYLTLLNMIKGNDYLKTEKAETETNMSKVLRDPKLSEGTKARKYNWLAKKRRQLKSEIEKPPKITIDPEQLHAIKADVSKYLGVASTTIPAKGTPAQKPSSAALKPTNSSNKKKTRSSSLATLPARQSEFNSPPREETSPDEEEPQSTVKPASSYIIHPNQQKHMQKIIKQNANKLSIDPKTKTIHDTYGPIEGSNYLDVVDYLTGYRQDKPPGTDILIHRMEGEKYFKTGLNWADWYRQRGEGRRRSKEGKTKGLIRVKPFKTIIWERL